MAVTLEEAKPSVAGFISDRLDRIDRLIQGCVDRQEIPGAVAILLKDGQIGYYRAFGWADLDTKKPMEKDALFRVASMSKLITTVATLQIYEKGHYDMGTPLADVLPEFAEPEVFVSWDEEKQVFVTEPAKQKIRMKHLFTHTSGIVYPVFTNAGRDGYLKAGITDACPDGTMDLAENIQRLAGVPLAHEPGEGYTYGMNMDVLGRVIEVVDGRPFARYMREEIFQPLGMTDTGFFVPEEKRERIVSIYTTVDGKLARFDETVIAQRLPNNYLEWWAKDSDKIALGGAGIVSTAYDCAQFLQMLVNKGDLDGKRILGRKTVEMLSRGLYSESTDATTAIGLSVSVVTGAQKHYHPESEGTFTWGGYFYTSFWVDPQEKFVGVLMSQINPAQTRLDGQFKIMAYSALE